MSRFHLRSIAVAVLAVSSFVTSADAQLSKKYQEWREGPEQWLMTGEEKDAWKKVKTDEEAIRFIDLFWVRRDPTPGTPKNEFREEVANRVTFADAKYADRGRRGALSDRGRVLIVLGQPTASSGDLAHSSHHALGTNNAAAGGGGRMRGSRETWIWEKADAQKYGRPRIEVVFVQDISTERIKRDVFRQDYPGAEMFANRKAIVNPEINEVPEWALFGGIEPQFKVTMPVPAPVPTTPAPAPAPAALPKQGKPAPGAAPAEVMASRGVSRFILLKDINDLDADSKKHPLAELSEVNVFAPGEELGWVTEYCAETHDEPTMRFTLRVTGIVNGEVVDRVAPEDEMVPDRLRADPGCYMVRGAVILEGLEPGDYKLTLTMEDTAVPGAYTQTRDFRVQ